MGLTRIARAHISKGLSWFTIDAPHAKSSGPSRLESPLPHLHLEGESPHGRNEREPPRTRAPPRLPVSDVFVQ